MDQVERDNRSLTTELNESKANQSRESMAWMDKEKQLKKRLKEGDRALVMISSQKDKLAEKEKILSTQVNETKEKNFKSITKLQAALQQTEGGMKESKEAKEALARKLQELELENQSLASELSENKSRLRKSEKTLVMVSGTYDIFSS